MRLSKTATLNIEFAGDRSIEVPPNKAYEAWQVGREGKERADCLMFVCMPAGSIAHFDN